MPGTSAVDRRIGEQESSAKMKVQALSGVPESALY